jgi:threonine dehydratase/serine racemase
VVVPDGAPATKRWAAEAAGARIVPCEPTMAARAEALARVVAETGAVEVHPFNDPHVMAGQGTAALELLQAVPAIALVVAPVSGGGLLCGTAIAARGVDPRVEVWGAEPAAVDDAARSLAAGHLVLDGATPTIADGLVAQLSEHTLGILLEHSVSVVTVTEEEIAEALRRLARDAKQIVEPSGAVPLAGIVALAGSGHALPSDVGVILSGGNVDLDRWARIVLGPGFGAPDGTA